MWERCGGLYISHNLRSTLRTDQEPCPWKCSGPCTSSKGRTMGNQIQTCHWRALKLCDVMLRDHNLIYEQSKRVHELGAHYGKYKISRNLVAIKLLATTPKYGLGPPLLYGPYVVSSWPWKFIHLVSWEEEMWIFHPYKIIWSLGPLSCSVR